jgi:hypothetical protein
MSPADGIRRLGFRRWYERQLIESHACFLTCFLCMILALACFEAVNLRSGGWRHVAMILLVFGAGAVGIAALKRYKSILDRAEHIAERSTCGSCEEYGRIRIVSANDPRADASAAPWMRVECRKCGNQWLIE